MEVRILAIFWIDCAQIDANRTPPAGFLLILPLAFDDPLKHNAALWHHTPHPISKVFVTGLANSLIAADNPTPRPCYCIAANTPGD